MRRLVLTFVAWLHLLLLVTACTVTPIDPKLQSSIQAVSVDIRLAKSPIVVAPSGGALLLLGGPLLQGIVNSNNGLQGAYLDILDKNGINIKQMFEDEISKQLTKRSIRVVQSVNDAKLTLIAEVQQYGLAETGTGLAAFSSQRLPYFNVLYQLQDPHGKELWGRRLVSQIDIAVPLQSMEVQDYFLQPEVLSSQSRTTIGILTEKAFNDWKH